MVIHSDKFWHTKKWWYQTVSERFQNGFGTVPKPFRNGSETVLKLFRFHHFDLPFFQTVISKRFQNGFETVPKRFRTFRNRSEIVLKPFRNRSETVARRAPRRAPGLLTVVNFLQFYVCLFTVDGTTTCSTNPSAISTVLVFTGRRGLLHRTAWACWCGAKILTFGKLTGDSNARYSVIDQDFVCKSDAISHFCVNK